MKGTYQHCGRQHLHRYAAEFAFRYSNRVANGVNDTMRAEKILKGAEGKRLTYQRTDARANAGSALYPQSVSTPAKKTPS